MQIVKLNLIPGGVLPVCYASQYDNGRVIRFLLFDGDTAHTLSGAESITLNMTKPDGAELSESVTNTSADYVDIVTTSDTCSVAGNSLCEIEITDGADVIGTGNFIMRIEADAYDGGELVPHTATGAIANFETNIPAPLQSITADIVAVQSGTGTPSPSNPRPISGFSGANITRSGVNLVNIKPFNQWTVIAGYPCQKKAIRENTRVYMSVIDNDPSVDVSGCYFGYVADDFLGGPLPTNQFRWVLKNGTIQSIKANYSEGDTTNYLSGLVFVPNNEATYNKIMARYKFVISTVEDITDYEPYNGDTLTATFGTTVFGGSVDVTGGKVTITHGIINLWDFNYSYNSGDATPHFTSNSAISDSKNPSGYGAIANILCSQYDNSKSWSSAFGSAGNNGYIALTPSGLFGISDDRYTSPSDFKTALQTENAKLVYELATPIEISITPDTLNTISGENNVWSDTGDIEVTYLVEE